MDYRPWCVTPHDLPTWLIDFKTNDDEVVSLGNSEQCKVTGSGIVLIDKLVDGEWRSARIKDVL